MNRDLCQICGRPVTLCQPSKNRVTGVPVGPYPTFDMAHIREIRPQAREIKFVIDATLAGPIRQWARAHLDADIHGGGPHGDAFDVFHRRGSFGRSKYRIRRYGDDDTVFLERKMRQPAVLAKRRTTLPLAALPQIIDSEVDTESPGYWFQRRVSARRLRPVCEVAYSRMARSVLRDGEPVRLTLDADLRARPASEEQFPDEANLPALPAMSGRLILELKYRGETPAVFRQLVEEFALAPQAASKYRLGVAAIGKAVANEAVTGAESGAEAFYA